jgi:hypothetical protein
MRVLAATRGERGSLRPQLPLGLDDHSEPEPDVAVCRPEPRDYADRHPAAAAVWLVVEVSDASLAYDRGPKTAPYARGGPTLWIVNIEERCLELHQDPEPALGRYPAGRASKRRTSSRSPKPHRWPWTCSSRLARERLLVEPRRSTR